MRRTAHREAVRWVSQPNVKMGEVKREDLLVDLGEQYANRFVLVESAWLPIDDTY